MAYQTTSADVKEMFGDIAPRYDITNTILSGGMHLLWKSSFIKNIPFPYTAKPSSILDLCCGTGDLLPILYKRFGCKVIGGDFCEPMLEKARSRFSSSFPSASNFEFVQADALNLPFSDNTFDIVTVAFGVRNFENLHTGLKEIHRVLKPSGVISILEFGTPSNKIFGELYRVYSKYVLPNIGWVLTGNKAAYEYLPRTAGVFPCGDEFKEILVQERFQNVKVLPYCWGVAYGYYGEKKY